MAVIPIWPGSSSFSSGSTPFGFYDNDLDFKIDSDKVANFCARRLGYPIVDVELQDLNFYTAFEESITTYGNELYAYQVRENFLSLEGASNTVDVKNTLLTPTLNRIIDFSQQYGVEAGVGGNIDWYDGLVGLSASVQDYDLNAWAVEQGYDSGDIEIKRVFYEAPPAIVRYFDPYAGTGTDLQGLLSTFGFGSYSPGINFLMMPLSFDIQKLQAIEFNDQVRKSNYSFEIRNNKLKIFPIPKATGGKLKIQYILKSERAAAAFQDGTNKITDVSNVPYTNPVYSKINSIGRSWMFEYTLAIVKEMLGYVRGKYGSVPIPGDTVTLNQSDLISAATLEKSNLIERLRTYFDETSREKLLESRTKETEFRKQELNEVPFTIYIS
tara:strand:- start:128 stop:1276 length:1149 start_codon:yes stop_codon:yes gene_type:complete